jgi:ABC-type sugar transport system permease subunit
VDRRQKAWSIVVLVPAVVSTAIFVYGFVSWTALASLTDWRQVRRVQVRRKHHHQLERYLEFHAVP